MRRAVILPVGVGVAIALSVVGSSTPAAGEERTAFVLDSESTADARTCADAEVLRAKVAERLGRDPFTTDADAGGRIHVAFARDNARAWTADIVLADPTGKHVGARTLVQAGATCEPLVGSVVFTLAVLLEDLAPQPPGPAREGPAPAPADTETALPPSPPPSPPPRRTRFDASIGVVGALGGAPAPSGGGEILLGLDAASLRFELSGRMYLPASSSGEVAVRTRLAHGRLASCYGWLVLSGCVVAAVGSVSAEAVGDGVVSSRLAGQLYAATGIGVVSRVFVVGDILFVRASLDLLFAMTRVGFDVGEQRVWTVPFASSAGTIALGARLP